MRKVVVIILAVLMLLCSAAGSESATSQLAELYAQAELLMVTGDYAGAAEKFDALGAYSDSSQMAMYCKAINLAETVKAYELAIDAFKKLGEFKDCPQMVIYYTARSFESYGETTLGDMKSKTDADLNKAKTIYEGASDSFAGLALFKDSITRLAACQGKIQEIDDELAARETARKEAVYTQAQEKESNGKYSEAIELYKTISGYKDSDERVTVCETMIKKTAYDAGVEYQANGEWALAVRSFTGAGDYSDAEEKISETYYMKGMALREAKDWDGAVGAFKDAGDYSDAKTQINETHYLHADDLEKAGKQEEAYKIFIALGDYEDAFERANKPYYEKGIALREEEDWDAAIAAFRHAGDYSDAKEKISETYYMKGMALREAKDWDGAAKAFRDAGDYSDAKVQINKTHYLHADELEKAGKQEEAYKIFIALGDYEDSFERANKPYYEKGAALKEAGDWDGAIEAFEHAGDYSDAKEQVRITYYMKGMDLREEKDWEGAAVAFDEAGDYNDAKEQVRITYYMKGMDLREAEDWDGAVEAFEIAGDYGDAKEKIGETYYMKGTALREGEDWDGAVEAFEAAGEYSDAKEQVSITYYTKGTALREAKDWDGAAKAFKDAGDYSDAKTQINETHYLHAEDLEKAGKQEEAYQIFISLGDYRDSFERANKPYYDLGMALWEKDDISGAASAFAHAGTYQDADKVIPKMYYTKAEADLKEHKYVDALIYYRMAGDYEDSFIKAIELEYRFRKLLVSSEHVFTALKADGSLYSATAKKDYTFSVPPFNSIVRYDRNTLGAVGITKDDKIVLTGDYTEFGVAKGWKYISDVKIGVLNIFALRSDGKIQVVKKYNSDDFDLDAIQQLKNIKKIEYLDAGSVFFALDQEGNVYGADTNHTFCHFDIKLSDIIIGKRYAVYGKGLDGQVYQFSQQEMSWKKISGDWYKDILFGDYRVTGTSDDRNILVKLDVYGITVELHKDGTFTADHRELHVDDWKLWNDQRELAEIFEWQPEEVKEKDYAGIYSQAEEALNTDEEKAYDLLASIIEYQPARELMNSNKKLIKIRNNHFTKGGRMRLGEKNSSGKMRFTILDQKKNKVLLLSDEMITMDAGKYVNYKKEFKTSRLYGYVTGLYDNMFSEKEQKAILPADNGTFKGEKVFILSKQEVMKYFPKAISRAKGLDWCTCTVHRKYAECLEVFDKKTGELAYTGANISEKSFPIALWLSLDELPLPAEE